jgi:hypothetical protein
MWAHLKGHPRGRIERFTFTVPLTNAGAVFGRLREKPEGEAWLDFLRAHVRKADSFEVDSWFDLACEISGDERRGTEWVICSLSGVSATESAIAIHGVAEQFTPGLYP